jgi:polyhydroxyalkanoate synthesis regulator phasin
MNSIIKKFVSENANCTINSIAKQGMGKNKANNELKDAVTQMVKSGELTKDSSGRYDTYSVALSGDSQEVKKFLAKAPNSTCGAISKGALGKAKAPKSLKGTLDQMVQAGVICKDSAGRFDMYSLVGETNVKTSAQPAPAKSKDVKLESVPNLKSKTMSGFSVKSTDQKGGVVIESKQGEIPLAAGEYLLVINDAPSWAVKSAEDVLSCIASYAQSKGFASYVVKNIATGKIIGSTNDISLQENRILTLEIARHNKAA